jgi:hypothetical protein
MYTVAYAIGAALTLIGVHLNREAREANASRNQRRWVLIWSVIVIAGLGFVDQPCAAPGARTEWAVMRGSDALAVPVFDLKATKNPRLAGLFEADDGTRTHDLLHGKRVVGSARLPTNDRVDERERRATMRTTSRRFPRDSLGFGHTSRSCGAETSIDEHRAQRVATARVQ